MNINATEELIRTLDEIDAKIKHLENSPNRVFVLVEYETLYLFHWFNECFKQFWDVFDHSSGQLLLFHQITKKHSELIDKYVALFREQIDYLESVIDFDYKCVKELPPVILSEDKRTDVIGYYMERFKDETDEKGNPLCYIDIDRDTHYDMINGKGVPTDFYMFRSDELNNKHYTGLVGMYHCLKSLYPLVYTVCSYPSVLQLGYTPSEEEIIYSLEYDLRKYAQQIGKNVDRELRKLFLKLKRTHNESLPTNVWGKVMELEDEAFRLAISEKLVGTEDERFEHIDEDQRKLWTDNYSLLQKIKDTCIDDELFDIRLSVETHNLLSALKEDNLDLFYELVLRRNIIHREMFPEKLDAVYEEWVNQSEEQQSGDVENVNSEDTCQEGTTSKETQASELEDGIRRSLERLMLESIIIKKGGKEVEEPLFNLQNHWQGVYRILVDKKYSMDADFEGFDTFISKAMPKVVNKPYSKESVKQISKTDFNIPFERWEYNGETSGTRKVYERMFAVTKRFKEILEEEGL